MARAEFQSIIPMLVNFSVVPLLIILACALFPSINGLFSVMEIVAAFLIARCAVSIWSSFWKRPAKVEIVPLKKY